jgi:hypothetical protein
MHEDVHQGARQQDEPRYVAEHMEPMLGDEENGRQPDKNPKDAANPRT